MDRFYAPAGSGTKTDSDTEVITLPEGEARHFLRVLRGKVGDQILLFDGQGHEMTAEATSVSKKEVIVRVLERRYEPPAGPRIVLATAVPKGERLRWLVEKATELGVDAIQPLLTQRSVVDPRPTKMARLENNVIAACKQCGRNHLMTLHEPQPLDAVLDAAAQSGEALIAAVPGGGTAVNVLSEAIASGGAGTIRMLVGPEGGWTEAELSRFEESGCLPIGLGRNILRIETAALGLAAIAGALRDQ